MTTRPLTGHNFSGWVLYRPMSKADQEKADVLRRERPHYTTQPVTMSIDRALAELEGDIVPTCECGWRGVRDDWVLNWATGAGTGSDHGVHVRNMQMAQVQHQYAARTASATLVLAATDWSGDQEVASWLKARAEHIETVGIFDGETWPRD